MGLWEHVVYGTCVAGAGGGVGVGVGGGEGGDFVRCVCEDVVLPQGGPLLAVPMVGRG
jgi:hypothetical protein